MTDWQNYVRVAWIVIAACALPCWIIWSFKPRKHKRSLDDLFHWSHTRATPHPEPINIDWEAFRSRRVK